MSSSPHKQPPTKMCKSPKNITYQAIKPEKVQIINEYENFNTNCTVIGSNNLHLVKKPQVLTNMSPVYSSNPSPGYPQSPYSSPASLKSPSPQSFKPPTPQPTYPVMQIIQSSHHLVARPIQAAQPQNVIKLKPHLNILPKPSGSPQPSPKPSVSPQIVIPGQQSATIMPTAQPLLLNQMPVLAPGVQLILRPQTTKMPTHHVQTATPQGIILQSSPQQVLQIQSPRTAQPMVRVLTNGMQFSPHVTTPVITHTATQQLVHNDLAQAQFKKKPKKKKQKLDLANIMKLSGIGDEDDIQFESDTSQSESEHTVNMELPHHHMPINNVIHDMNMRSHTNVLHTSDNTKRIGNIQISAVGQPTVSTATPLVQLLNQGFQSGLSNTANFHTQATASGIPLNSFLTPNITINNGLVVQRNGGFKLALGEDGRLVLQHDPTLNQDLQSQLLLQSIFGLNGLVLQPSIDQQVHSQTVQTIQQQSVQTIQQQTVQSQTIQTVQQQTVQPHHTLQSIQPQIQAVQPQTVQQTVQQTIQHQTVQSQPMQIVQPQPIHTLQPHNLQHTLQSPVHQIQSILHSQPLQAIHSQSSTPTIQSQNHTVQSQPILKVQPFQKSQPPVQTVHPQPINHHHHHHHHVAHQNMNEHHSNNTPPTSYVVNLTPEQLEQLKRNGQLTVNGQTIFMQRPNAANHKTHEAMINHSENALKKLSPKLKPAIKKVAKVVPPVKIVHNSNDKVLNHIKEISKSTLISALQAPPKIIPQQKTVAVQPTVQSSQTQTSKPQVTKTQTAVQTDSHTSAPDVDHLIGQILDESHNPSMPPQRVHTIQLTPQQQQHLKNIQLQIQTLSSRLTPNDTEMHTALKMLFAEQQKILASGKLLPPDKVIYQNNQLTIINPSSLGIGAAPAPSKPETPVIRKDSSVSTVQTPIQLQKKITVPVPTPTISVHQNNVVVHPIMATTTTAAAITTTTTTTTTIGQTVTKLSTLSSMPSVTPLVQQNKYIPSFTKAQLLEQQLSTDQNGAMKPDIHTPFRDKADACKRLIRYHCYNQPVLSLKDLNKADEIFELTARHFIDKFSKMVEKYRYLLLKQSMKQVETSELMMLDRLFLAEEQESLMRLRQQLEEGPPAELVAQFSEQPEEYDEWACIQRELGCLPEEATRVMKQTIPKRSSSDIRLESLKRFRVEKHNKRSHDMNISFNTTKAPFNSQNNMQSVSVHKHGFNHQVRHHPTYSVNNQHMLSQQDITMQMQSQPIVYNSVNNKSQSSESESGNNSLDEHVQSAIDSILNLQQNSSMDLDEAVSSILS